MNDDGTSNTVYPTYRELAEKYGVAPSVIADYAKSHNTMHRRKYGEHRIEARRDESFDRRAMLDLRYIDGWSVWLDMKIIAKTLPALLQGR